MNTIYKSLKHPERFSITMIYLRKWRKYVKNSGLKDNEKAYFKLYFQEIHARYYQRVIQTPAFKTTNVLILNFFFSRVNENLRGILTSLKPYNLTMFVHAVRSQIELNALMDKFITDESYYEKFQLLNEDRKKIKELETVTNINTLIEKLGEDLLPYKTVYDNLSLILHPNPTSIRFYAQTEGTPTEDKNGVYQPNIDFYFSQTISEALSSVLWFRQHIWLFLTMVEHFLILADNLKHNFFVSEIEKKQYTEFCMAEVLSKHKKELLKIANSAKNEEEIKKNLNVFINKIFKDLE